MADYSHIPDIMFVDRNDTPIGTANIRQVYSTGKIARIVRVFLINKDGQVMIQKRSATMHTFPLCWDQSMGGHVDAGEDYATATVRELKEELGVEIKQSDLIPIANFFTQNHHNGEFVRRFNQLYAVRYDGLVTIDDDEVAEIRWIDLDELQAWVDEKPKDFTVSVPLVVHLFQHANIQLG